jgi:hypothetical protein
VRFFNNVRERKYAMIVKLSLGDVERARLVLRGGSVLDWRRLNVTSLAEGDAILRVNGFDPEKDKVYAHESPEPGDEDLLDFTAIQTLIKGGTVFAVSPEEVPDQTLVAAVLRY